MRKLFLGLAGILLLAVGVYFLYDSGTFLSLSSADEEETSEESSSPRKPKVKLVSTPQEPVILFGIPADSFLVINETIQRGESLSQILQPHNISQVQMNEIRLRGKTVFNLRQMQAGQSYTLLCDNDSAKTARYFIYEPSIKEYIIFDLRDSIQVNRVEKEVATIERVVSGTIQNNLYTAMIEAGCSPGLINHFADIYSWRINFAAIQPGDQFKLIFEEHLVEGEPIGYGELKATYFEHKGKPLYAFKYGEGKNSGYYDQDGKSLKRAFLKEPLEYSRISSRFTMNRFHPVQKRYKPHLGTDFAAPTGTPIRSVGDGVVLEASYTAGNGNYVKIQHDKTYTTQYLHMSKFAKGIKKGTKVQTGQTIGYVGSSGLATGPHLCYRFWKNGKQVDALKEKLPGAKPIDPAHKKAFMELSKELLSQFENDGKEPALLTADAETTALDS
jgi:murein DD-endopeptidase MepM/ murein hydrolase activator NlpD